MLPTVFSALEHIGYLLLTVALILVAYVWHRYALRHGTSNYLLIDLTMPGKDKTESRLVRILLKLIIMWLLVEIIQCFGTC